MLLDKNKMKIHEYGTPYLTIIYNDRFGQFLRFQKMIDLNSVVHGVITHYVPCKFMMGKQDGRFAPKGFQQRELLPIQDMTCSIHST